MNKHTQNQLNAELKRMLDQLDRAAAEQKEQIPRSGTGNIIRRRKGEKETRFFTRAESRLCVATAK